MFRLNSSQVGLPYLRAKAQDYYESVGGGVDPEILDDFQRERYLAAPRVCAVPPRDPILKLPYRLGGSSFADYSGPCILGARPRLNFGYSPIMLRICSTNHLSTDHGSPGWALIFDARAWW